MMYSILVYACAAYIALIVAGGLAGSVSAVLCTAASAFLAYGFQSLEVARPAAVPMSALQVLLWVGSMGFGVASAIISLYAGAN